MSDTKLRFYARDHHKVRIVPASQGQLPRYAGRELTPPHAPTEEPFVAPVSGPLSFQLRARARAGELWAADTITAQLCGVEHVELEFIDHAWRPKRPKQTATKPKASAEAKPAAQENDE